MTNEAAAIKLAERDNLVAELAIRLRTTTHMLQATCLLISDNETRAIALDAVREANTLLAKAREVAQS